MNIKVQAACCSCGLPRLIGATETKFDKTTIKEFTKLLKKGYYLKSMTIEEARASDMCFDNSHMKNS